MKRFFPRWWRILMMEAALVGGILGHFYAVHHRPLEMDQPPVPAYVWLDLAADAAAFGRDVAAAHAIQILAGMEPE